MTRCYFEEGYLETPVFLLEQLSCDHSIPGPAIIIDKNRQEMGAGGTPGGWRGPWRAGGVWGAGGDLMGLGGHQDAGRDLGELGGPLEN